MVLATMYSVGSDIQSINRGKSMRVWIDTVETDIGVKNWEQLKAYLIAHNLRHAYVEHKGIQYNVFVSFNGRMTKSTSI